MHDILPIMKVRSVKVGAGEVDISMNGLTRTCVDKRLTNCSHKTFSESSLYLPKISCLCCHCGVEVP